MFVQSFASAANFGGYMGISHGIRGLTDACALMISSITSTIDVRLPWCIGAAGLFGKMALIVALSSEPIKQL